MLADINLENCIEPLLTWFAGHARVLPWRENPTPYRVWISEIMLQQTRVEAVKPYFERFLEALPDVASLASCPEDELLKLWEGLGYYNRVRNLQAAAQQIMSDYAGTIPAAYEDLLKLKGIGHYTAGAISSIAYGRRAAAVDGNVLRVLTRLTADDTDIMKASFRAEVEDRLTAALPENACGNCNQALMELGATVCVPNGDPKCMECPWKTCCLAHAQGTESLYPVKTKKKPRRIEEKTILVIRDGANLILHKRPAKGLLAGLYEFPNEAGHLSKKEALKAVEALGFTPLRIQPLPDAKHIFTHIEWHMSGYLLRIAEAETAPAHLILASLHEIEEKYSIPSAFAVYKEAVGAHDRMIP